MSLLLQSMQGIQGLSDALYNTSWAALRGVCAMPVAFKNGAVGAVATLANGSLRIATDLTTALKNTSVQFASSAISRSWQATTWVATGATSGITSAAVGLGNVAVRGVTLVKDAAIAKSVQNYGELFFRIQSVKNKIFNELSGKLSLTQFNRNELAEKLDDLIDSNAIAETDSDFVIRLCNDLRNPSVIFDKSREPDLARLEKILPPDFTMPVSQANRNELAERLEEFVELYSLDKKHNDFILGFCAELRDAKVIFDKSKEVEMGRLEKILEPHSTKYQRYISSKIAEREQLEKVPGLTTLASPKLTPEETLDGIGNQVDLLKSNSIKLVMGSIILNMTLGLYTFEGIDFKALKIDCEGLGITPPDGKNTNLINFLIEVSNRTEIEGKSSEEDFKDLLYLVIDNSRKNIFTRLHAKMRCGYLFGLVTNLVGNLFDNLKTTLVHLAKLPPAQQLEEITKLLINPLLEHLSDVDGSKPANPAVPKTSDQILDQFIDAFLAQFLDVKYQPWTQTAHAMYKKAQLSGHIEKAFYTTLAHLLWLGGIIIAPVQWMLNKTIHLVLKTIIIGLCPTLSNTTKTALDIGEKHAWHSLKNSLLNMLQQVRLTSLLPRAEDPIFQPPKEHSAEIKEKLITGLDKLLKILPGPDGKDLITFLQKSLHGNLGSLKDIITNAVSELTLDMVAQDGFISGTLLSSLASINASGFQTSTVDVSEAKKQQVDAELQKELGLLGDTILQAVSNASRSDRSNQSYANTHITAIKQNVQAFNENLLQLQKAPDLSFKKHALESCARFTESMKDLRTKITETVDASTQALLMPHIDKAFEHVRKISEELNEAHQTKVLKQIEAKLNALYPYLKMPLDNEEEINEILAELGALNPSLAEAFAKDYDDLLEIYVKRLKSAKRKEQHPRAYSKPFFILVADYKDRANRAAQNKIDSTRESARLLAQWADELKFVKVQSKPTVKNAGFAHLYSSPLVIAATSAGIQAYGKNLFAFIGNEKNLKGIVQRTMEAYSTKKAMMPKKPPLDDRIFDRLFKNSLN